MSDFIFIILPLIAVAIVVVLLVNSANKKSETPNEQKEDTEENYMSINFGDNYFSKKNAGDLQTISITSIFPRFYVKCFL